MLVTTGLRYNTPMNQNRYNPTEIESKWTDIWRNHPAIVSAVDHDPREKFYMLVEFPYPSGAGLHVGHVWGYTMGDVIARYQRMQGKNVLFPMGWDAFGLPTENYAIKTGIAPQVATAENVKVFKDQMERMGFSFDWEREINTTDPEYYKWTQWIFLQLLKKGLAYKQKMPINWCPKCKTGLANEEVTSEGIHERCYTQVEQRLLDQWVLKITAYADRLIDDLATVDYTSDIKAQQINWIGRSEGAYIDFVVDGLAEKVTVFTTRADTLPGATYLVLAPEHPLVSVVATREQLPAVSAYVDSAKQKSELQRAREQREKSGVFTGAYAVNPYNQEKIPVWVSDYVLMGYGTGAIMAVPAHDERDLEFANIYNLPVVGVEEVGEAAIEKMISSLEKAGIGKRGVEYKLRDWVFSRQRYWGEPIPIVHCEKCGYVPVPEDQLPVTLPAVENLDPTEDGRSPLARATEWVNVTCPTCGADAKRETDTMPNWAGSSWYFLRYLNPHDETQAFNKNLVSYFMPVDLYIGGAEHTTLHVLYSRFWHKFLFDIGLVTTVEPYAMRRNRGIILAPDGRKMSKSYGNVINPNDEVAKVGADTLRMYELFIGPYADTFPWNPAAEKGVYRFLERVWRTSWGLMDAKHESTNQVVLAKLHHTIKKVGLDLIEMKFNTAIAAMMEFINTLEEYNFQISRSDWQKFILVLAPFAPFITEEIWQSMYAKPNDDFSSVHQQRWPGYSADLLVEQMVMVPVQVNGKLRGMIEVPRKEVVDHVSVIAKAKHLEPVAKLIAQNDIIKEIYVEGKMVSLVVRIPNHEGGSK